MQNTTLILRDDVEIWQRLLPLTFTKPISHLRIGIDTIKQKWEAYLNLKAEIKTEAYLMPKFQDAKPKEPIVLEVNSSIIPNEKLSEAIKKLSPHQCLKKNGVIIAQKIQSDSEPMDTVEYSNNIIQIKRPWHLFLYNEEVFRSDFKRITKGRESQAIPQGNQALNQSNIFIEKGATVEFSLLDATEAPIYIGKNAKILMGCMIKGGLALCESATLKMGTKHYGTSTIGPHSKIGGEVSNIVVQAYSNKGHDGYLGNAVLGEWCNLGADTNASNLKNNYGMVRAYSYKEKKLVDTNQQFVGLLMGDHAKCGINTMFNTGTVVGVAANIFGGGFPKKHIPSFTWGGVDFLRTFQLKKAYEMADKMMNRRGIQFTENDKKIFDHIFKETENDRP